jgi:hypothetical protein
MPQLQFTGFDVGKPKCTSCIERRFEERCSHYQLTPIFPNFPRLQFIDEIPYLCRLNPTSPGKVVAKASWRTSPTPKEGLLGSYLSFGA